MAELSSAWFHRLKAAQRDLIKLSGGIQRAADVTSCSKSEVGRWNNAGDTDLMPLAAVLTLENECGIPAVTSAMAELNNRRLADPDAGEALSGCVLARHADAMVQASTLMAAGAAALSDGRLTPAEAQTMDRAASDLERGLSSLRKVLAGARGAGLSVVGGAS